MSSLLLLFYRNVSNILRDFSLVFFTLKKSHCFSLPSSVIFKNVFIFCYTGGLFSLGIFRTFPLGLHFVGAGHSVRSESLVQQPESKLVHILFTPAFHPIRMMNLDVFIFFAVICLIYVEHKPQILLHFTTQHFCGRNRIQACFTFLLCGWLLLLPFCSVKQVVTSGGFCTCFK